MKNNNDKSNGPAANGAEENALPSSNAATIAQTAGAGNIPVIVDWKKYESGYPTYWEVTIAGSKRPVMIANIRDITDYKRFTDQCLKQLNMVFMPVVTPAEWAHMLKAAQPLIKTYLSGSRYEDGKFVDEGGEA